MIIIDPLETAISRAHALFGKTSIFEVLDLDDRRAAIRTIVELYGLVEVGRVDEYMRVLNQIKEYVEELK